MQSMQMGIKMEYKVEYIRSKDLCLLIRDTFKLMDRRLMDHGSRTAYIFYKMLECKGGYEKFELADLMVLATLHDIGAYKTDNIGDLLRFESRDYMPHSIYGYLFLKYLSPLKAQSKILLYHHIDYDKMDKLEYEFKKETSYLSLAEKTDIYHNALGSKFDPAMFDKYVDTKFSRESLELLAKAIKEYDIFEKIKTEEYQKDLDELLEFVLFNDDEKQKYLEMLMYCIGFRNADSVVDTVTTICVCKEIGRLLLVSKDEMDLLYYGSLLHDLGMLAIPKSIIQAARKLTKEEQEIMRRHVELEEKILRNRIHQEVVDIAVSHHERGDGSGYPKKLKDFQMNQLQGILQVADTVTGLTNKRNYREPRTKDEVILILQNDADRKKLNKEVVNAMVTFYDEIMDVVKIEKDKILSMHTKLHDKFEQVHRNFTN